MKTLLRRGIERMPAPLPVLIQDSFRYFRYGQVRRRRRIQSEILGRLASRGTVTQGPFRGMKYISTAFCSEILPKVIGTYELELNPAIEAICNAGCDRIVDIGAAEGYYAIGLAIRNPTARVIGFEMSASARYYCRQLAKRNGVSDQVEMRGTCTPEGLARALSDAEKPAVVCDCEGAEDVLLRPNQIDPLRRSFVLVETHDGLETDAGILQGITAGICERFKDTHAIQLITSQARTEGDLPAGLHLSPDEAAEAMDEGRPWGQWLFLVPQK